MELYLILLERKWEVFYRFGYSVSISLCGINKDLYFCYIVDITEETHTRRDVLHFPGKFLYLSLLSFLCFLNLIHVLGRYKNEFFFIFQMSFFSFSFILSFNYKTKSEKFLNVNKISMISLQFPFYYCISLPSFSRLF